jgi:hypothetical protein
MQSIWLLQAEVAVAVEFQPKHSAAAAALAVIAVLSLAKTLVEVHQQNHGFLLPLGPRTR